MFVFADGLSVFVLAIVVFAPLFCQISGCGMVVGFLDC